MAQQLIAISSEFHTSNVNIPLSLTHPSPPVIASRNRAYKAVVVLYLNGGADSWNMLVPHSSCEGGKNMYQEYANARTNRALPKEELYKISVPDGNQPCDNFGVHPSLTKLADRYKKAGDAAFVAN